MRIVTFFILFSVLCHGFSASAQSESSSLDQSFRAGAEAYHNSKFEDAEKNFSAALQNSPNNVYVLTNLGLSEYQLGKKGLAIGLWRKAVSIDPEFSVPKAALRFALKQLTVKEIPHEVQFWENFRSQVLAPIPLIVFLVMSLILFLSGGWLFSIYFGQRKRSIREEKAPPPFPVIAGLFACAFVFCIGCIVLELVDYSTTRATVTDAKVSVKAGPDNTQADLFDIYEGLEVIVRQVQQDWAQVTYPGGQTGWVPKASLLQTSGRTQW